MLVEHADLIGKVSLGNISFTQVTHTAQTTTAQAFFSLSSDWAAIEVCMFPL